MPLSTRESLQNLLVALRAGLSGSTAYDIFGQTMADQQARTAARQAEQTARIQARQENRSNLIDTLVENASSQTPYDAASILADIYTPAQQGVPPGVQRILDTLYPTEQMPGVPGMGITTPSELTPASFAGPPGGIVGSGLGTAAGLVAGEPTMLEGTRDREVRADVSPLAPEMDPLSQLQSIVDELSLKQEYNDLTSGPGRTVGTIVTGIQAALADGLSPEQIKSNIEPDEWDIVYSNYGQFSKMFPDIFPPSPNYQPPPNSAPGGPGS